MLNSSENIGSALDRVILLFVEMSTGEKCKRRPPHRDFPLYKCLNMFIYVKKIKNEKKTTQNTGSDTASLLRSASACSVSVTKKDKWVLEKSKIVSLSV